MRLAAPVLLLLLAGRAAAVPAVGDDELQYIVGIEREALTSASEGSVVMTAKSGQKYACRLPPRNGQGVGAADFQDDKDDEDRLPPPETACMELSTGYWSYRVCPFDRISQLHDDVEILLGTFNAAVDAYVDGAGGRTARVEYVCDLRGRQEPYVLSVDEATLLQYVITVATQRACRDSPAALLEALRGRCAHYNTGWWTYEFCYGKAVRQYHVEQKKVTVEFVLGSVVDPSTTVAVQGASPQESYLSQWYTDGTVCDLTRLPRRVEVRFFCGDSDNALAVQGFKETATCVYVLHVTAKASCKHSQLRPVRGDVKSIICRPLEGAVAERATR